jgi:hypothetical protein
MESRRAALQTVQLHAKQRRRAGVQQTTQEYGRICTPYQDVVSPQFVSSMYTYTSSQLSSRSFYEVPRKRIASFLEACRWAGRVDISFLPVSLYLWRFCPIMDVTSHERREKEVWRCCPILDWCTYYQGYSGLWRCDWKAADKVHHAKPQGLSPVWAVLRTIIFVTCENVGCYEGLPRLWRC